MGEKAEPEASPNERIDHPLIDLLQDLWHVRVGVDDNRPGSAGEALIALYRSKTDL